jgi:hypothetical protein
MEYTNPTNNCHKESSTTAKTALGLSIGALGVELLGAGGGGILSGLLNRPASTPVTAELLPMVLALIPMLQGQGYSCNGSRVCELESEVARLRAEKYSDLGNINTFKEAQSLVDKNDEKYGARFEKIFDELVANRVSNARQEEQIKCLQKETDYKLGALRDEMKLGFTNLGHAIEVESERRAHADEDIVKWSDCKYVQYKRVVDASQICPPVQLAATAGGASNAQPTNVVVSGTVTTQAAA